MTNSTQFNASSPEFDSRSWSPPLWAALILPALAGGMGWGIRGQYGHETGAMIPGLFVALMLVFLYCGDARSLRVARILALTAVGFSFGGVQTYGQTLGLSQSIAIRETGYWWGMLGCFVKGSVWIGLGGAFLGMGLSGKKYRPGEMAILILALIGLMLLGIQVFNRPFDKPELPRIYFSDYWGVDQPNWKPRAELWGGLWLALIGLIVYLRGIKKDRLAGRLALVGIPAGGLGFSLGQSIQAYHAWHGPFESLDPYTNWWGVMEITFGLILGLGLGLGCYLFRDQISSGDGEEEYVPLGPWQEAMLFVAQAAALIAWSFSSIDAFDRVADLALTMGLIPLVVIVGGRYGPYLCSLPLLALPIAGKTLRDLAYRSDLQTRPVGWLIFVAVPLGLMVLAALHFAYWGRRGQPGRIFTKQAAIFCPWFYVYLSFSESRYPFPWRPFNTETTRQIFFVGCATAITAAVLMLKPRTRHLS